MSNVNTKTYIDIHTTGQRHEFSSVKAYDKFLKANHSYVITNKDIERIKNSTPKSKTNYKEVVGQAWKERDKYIPEIKNRIAKEQYELRNGRR